MNYLLGRLPEATVIVISGRALGRISEACSVARTLQPSVVVVEDVDLIAEERSHRPGEHPLLFQLLNEMEGLNSATDITFLLTTNRADLLEPALAARPGPGRPGGRAAAAGRGRAAGADPAVPGAPGA